LLLTREKERSLFLGNLTEWSIFNGVIDQQELLGLTGQSFRMM
jgi:hypothetical protein